eukprot:TRINITY_DN100745_c0_g1_i1.p1 TRINITY_DN100745_c0_g1~~TRINITY_DN100745_c0_g1_i1.p1  ORF type:complete len:574 (-),score=80.17 TRINITY_DN100745_c0_g1_i1:28-1749(-)
MFLTALALVSLPAVVSAVLEDGTSAMALDDECSGSDLTSCGVSALQRRSSQTVVKVDMKTASEQEHSPFQLHASLCDPWIVALACQRVNHVLPYGHESTAADIHEVVNAAQLAEELMVSRESMHSFLSEYLKVKAAAKGEDSDRFISYEVGCAELCSKTLQSFPPSDRPPASDVACYMPAESKIPKCDLDVCEEALGNITFGDQNPFTVHKNPFTSNITVRQYSDDETLRETKQMQRILHNQDKINNTGEAQILQALRYPYEDPQEIAIMIAHLFRIYPLSQVRAVDRKTEAWKQGDLEALELGGEWKDRVIRVAVQAQAYAGTAIRNMNSQKGRRIMERWFGSDDVATKAEVRRVLGSVHALLSNVDYVYPGANCKQGVFAYVYPNPPLNTNKEGQFVFHLCPHYMEVSESLQIGTLIHEASHHRMGLTKDECYKGTGKECVKAYGRFACERLASIAPAKALHNADNLAYFVNDVQPGRHEPECPQSPKCTADSSCGCADGFNRIAARTSIGKTCYTCKPLKQCPLLPRCRKLDCLCQKGMVKHDLKAASGGMCHACSRPKPPQSSARSWWW